MARLNLVLLAIWSAALSLGVATPGAQPSSTSSASSRSRAYEVEFGQLQLEQSTWSMPARVEKIAREQLHMQVPGAGRVEIVALPATGGEPR
jgi:cell division protein FtsL